MDFIEINKWLKNQNEEFQRKVQSEMTDQARADLAEELNEVIMIKHQNKECFCEESHRLFEVTSSLRYSESWPRYIAIQRQSKCWSCLGEHDSDFERKLNIETSGNWKP